MSAEMVEDLNSSLEKERLVYLMQRNIHKGRLELLYKLYKKEIHELSLQGASKIISKELGYQVGVQTIRSLRIKSQQLRKAEEPSEDSESLIRRVNPTSMREVATGEHPTPGAADIENFKPIDVFDKEYKKEPSLIQWAKQ